MEIKKETRLISMKDYDIFKKGFGHQIYMEGDNPAAEIHHHDYYELVFFLGDEPIEYYYEGKYYTLRKGDIALCGMFQNHRFGGQEEASFKRISLGVTSDMLIKCSHEDSNLFQVFNPKQPYFPVLSMNFEDEVKYMGLLKEYLQYSGLPNQHVMQRAWIHVIIASLYKDYCIDIPEDTANYGHLRLVSKILEYVDKNISRWITVEEIAEVMNYSAGYTSKVFKLITGESLNQYMLKKRIEHAEYLICNGETIVEASERTGFDNYSYFYKAFKKIKGISPKEYQEKMKKKQG